jgi:hypothetical protein
MSTIDPDELAELMAEMADNQTAVIAFVALYRDTLAGVVRHHLRQLCRRDLAADPAEVEGLVWDVALFLQGRAGSWQPGSALPWNWARRGIAKLVADAIGHARADIDIDIDVVAQPVILPGCVEVEFADLDSEPRVVLLTQALAALGCRDRDRQVHVEYRIQAANGDPSPAHTVAELFGLRPDHVRQIDHRLRGKLDHLARTDPTFAPLAGLPWVTGQSRPRDVGSVGAEAA